MYEHKDMKIIKINYLLTIININVACFTAYIANPIYFKFNLNL